jgi:hypothetical protein
VELDPTEEEPATLNELIKLHIEELGYSTVQLAGAMNLHFWEFVREYRIEDTKVTKPGILSQMVRSS